MLPILALVAGVLALMIFWVPFVGLFWAGFFGLAAIILGGIGLAQASQGRASGKGMAIGGLTLAGVAIVGAIVSTVLTVVAAQSANDAVTDALDDTEGGATTAPASPSPSTAATEAPESTDVLALGEAGEVDEYTVTVTVQAVNLNANDVIAEVNEFNSPLWAGTCSWTWP